DLKTRARAPAADELRNGLENMAASDRVPPIATFTTSDARVENAQAITTAFVDQEPRWHPPADEPTDKRPTVP
ncbi:MAG: hypothetical protein ABW154_06640, partial [Dyella sp.]